MKKIILLVASLFVLSVFAAEPTAIKPQSMSNEVVKSYFLGKKAKRHLKVLAYTQPSKYVDNNNDDYGPPDSDDLDLHRAYARPKLVVIDQDNFDISPEIANRLKLARQQAINRYREIWCGGGEV